MEPRLKNLDIAGVPPKWQQEELEELLASQGWTQIRINHRRTVQHRPVWEARAMPPPGSEKRGAWQYQCQDLFHISLTSLLERVCMRRILLRFVVPRKKWSAEVVDSEDPPSRGRTAKRAVHSDGARLAPNLDGDSRGRSRSREKDKDQPDTQLDDLTPPGEGEPMDMEANQHTAQHHDVHLEAEDYHDALKKGWQEVDQLGVGDCGWRAIVDNIAWARDHC